MKQIYLMMVSILQLSKTENMHDEKETHGEKEKRGQGFICCQ